MIAGKVAVVCATETWGKGYAQSLRGMGAQVVVTEVDPSAPFRPPWKATAWLTVEDTLGWDIYVTTGNCNIIRIEHMEKMKDQAIVNIGHFDNEIQVHKPRPHPASGI